MPTQVRLRWAVCANMINLLNGLQAWQDTATTFTLANTSQGINANSRQHHPKKNKHVKNLDRLCRTNNWRSPNGWPHGLPERPPRRTQRCGMTTWQSRVISATADEEVTWWNIRYFRHIRNVKWNESLKQSGHTHTQHCESNHIVFVCVCSRATLFTAAPWILFLVFCFRTKGVYFEQRLLLEELHKKWQEVDLFVKNQNGDSEYCNACRGTKQEVHAHPPWKKMQEVETTENKLAPCVMLTEQCLHLVLILLNVIHLWK